MDQPIPEGEWQAHLFGGPHDGHSEAVVETPDFIEVGMCPDCREPHCFRVGEGPSDAQPYSLAGVDGYTARYEWTFLETTLDPALVEEKELSHA